MRPIPGRHIAFDGGLLHGGPAELATPFSNSGERLSLVVNIWLQHRPLGVTLCSQKQSSSANAGLTQQPPVLFQPGSTETLVAVEADKAAVALPVEFGMWRISGIRVIEDTRENEVLCFGWYGCYL